MKGENQAVVHSELEWVHHDVVEGSSLKKKRKFEKRITVKIDWKEYLCETEWVGDKEINRKCPYRNGFSGDGVWKKFISSCLTNKGLIFL